MREKLPGETWAGVAAVFHSPKGFGDKSGRRLGIGRDTTDDFAATEASRRVVLIVGHDLKSDTPFQQQRLQHRRKPRRQRVRVDRDRQRDGDMGLVGRHQLPQGRAFEHAQGLDVA